MSPNLNSALTLPCGFKIKNRIAKAAMSEDMASVSHSPKENFRELYRRWAEGGAGLVITGNVMVNSQALGEPNNVVIEEGLDNYLELKAWAQAGCKNNTALWVQLNHPGKQSPKFLSKKPMAPSAIGYPSPLNKFFNQPQAMSEIEIYDTIKRFAFAAAMCKKAGFSGVQIHGAHGYLVSQFLSPLHNQRTDKWGGPLENRLRFLKKLYEAIRLEVGEKFPVGLKLNSADFQKGGFSEDESTEVVMAMAEAGIDLLEISGGTYENPKMMMGTKAKESTIKREAYFGDYCAMVRSKIKTPLILTGGFRTASGMKQALTDGVCDMVGLARSLAIDPALPNKILAGQAFQSEVRPISSGIKAFDKRAPLEIFWYTHQLRRMGQGLEPDKKASPLWILVKSLAKAGSMSFAKLRA